MGTFGKLATTLLVTGAMFHPSWGHADGDVQSASKAGAGLTLADLVQRVIERNESMQEKLLSMEASRHRHLAEHGIFEPELFTSASREVNNRQNNTEQAAAANNVSVLQETNDVYGGGLETLLATGGRVRLGYNLSDIRNNIPIVIGPVQAPVGDQWQTFYGFSVEQPLLKNFGPAVTMAGIRIAALSSKIAFQEYRREFMKLISTAEATYWNLYLAQEQVRSFEESVKTAETILRDNRTRLEAGKGSELEVLEAQAGMGLRQAKLEEARQKVIEAVNRVISLYGEIATGTNLAIRVTDIPRARTELPDYVELRQKAFDLNPDYLIQQEKTAQELVRLGFAKNQRLPQLNLKGAYGLNGLGGSPSSSFENVSQGSFPSWSLGMEFRVPIGGGEKTRHELKAAEMQAQSAELGLHTLQTEILNGMDTTWHKVQSARRSVDSYQASVNYNQGLLTSALARLDEGKIESRKVLEIEADLLEAKNSVAESMVRDEIARLELELIEGALLQKRHLELTQRQLESATQLFADSSHVGDEQYARGVQAVQQLYRSAQQPEQSTDTPLQRKLREQMREKRQQENIKDENLEPEN